jgi:dTDP-4-dehydrorhamnose 3,5-epimerase
MTISLPQCEKGIGAVIRSSTSPDLIAGVRVTPITLWPDDRGYFLEVMRLAKDAPVAQVSAALSYPGTIKAFHYHQFQTDWWTPTAGMLQTALVDLRQDSPTFGARNTLYVGALRPWQILIPPGVAHGYKVIGTEPAVLVYLTDRTYDPEDEGRLPHNHSGIQYDWELQHK